MEVHRFEHANDTLLWTWKEEKKWTEVLQNNGSAYIIVIKWNLDIAETRSKCNTES